MREGAGQLQCLRYCVSPVMGKMQQFLHFCDESFLT